jgi:hypothetical protein
MISGRTGAFYAAYSQFRRFPGGVFGLLFDNV